jgi:hypothetical protein
MGPILLCLNSVSDPYYWLETSEELPVCTTGIPPGYLIQ